MLTLKHAMNCDIFSQFITCLLLCRPVFDPRPDHVRFVVVVGTGTCFSLST